MVKICVALVNQILEYIGIFSFLIFTKLANNYLEIF